MFARTQTVTTNPLSRTSTLTAVLSLLLLSLGSRAVLAQEEFVDRTNGIKAVYVLNFGKYVTASPANSSVNSGDYIVGIVGPSSMTGSLENVARKKTINSRKMKIISVTTAAEALGCNLLYVPHGQNNQFFPAIAAQVRGKPILLVGDEPGFAQQGGMINFYRLNNNIKFEINLGQAQTSGLIISSKLLKIGRPIPARPE
ncbi:MAG: hypothetical protein ACI87E_000797 [Mariniblastus sp.]|jgi:hypothetical protein